MLKLLEITRNRKFDWIWQAWKSIIIFVLKMFFVRKKDEVRDKTESRKELTEQGDIYETEI